MQEVSKHLQCGSQSEQTEWGVGCVRNTISPFKEEVEN